MPYKDRGVIVKSTGIVRKIDLMGRVVLPMETRKLLNLVNEDCAVEIYTDNESIILKKYVPACIFCNSADNVVEFHGDKICKDCIEKLNALVEQ